jgi:hypothetical protein
MAPANSARIDEAQKLAKIDPRKAETLYKEIISKPPSATSDAAVREYETALVSLGELYRDEKWARLLEITGLSIADYMQEVRCVGRSDHDESDGVVLLCEGKDGQAR